MVVTWWIVAFLCGKNKQCSREGFGSVGKYCKVLYNY